MKTLITIFLLLACSVAQAQTNLVGRVYHNSNVIDGKYLTGKLDEEMPFKLTRTK